MLCVPDPEGGREIDVALPHPLPVTPQIRGALRAVPGVVLVEEL
jgi:DNA polymerase-3 subunit alpha